MKKFTAYMIDALSSDSFEDKLVLGLFGYGLVLAVKSLIGR